MDTAAFLYTVAPIEGKKMKDESFVTLLAYTIRTSLIKNFPNMIRAGDKGERREETNHVRISGLKVMLLMYNEK